MPCWEIQTMSLELNSRQKDLIQEAMKSIGMATIECSEGLRVPGWGIVMNLEKGTVDFPKNATGKVNEIRRAIAAVAVKRMAAKKRWVLKKTANNKFQARRY